MNTKTIMGYDYLCKVLVIGESGVGKTSMLSRYVDNMFDDKFVTTIGVDFKVKTLTIGEHTIKLQIWDTGGQERFRTITTSYYRGAQGIIIVYDITNNATLKKVGYWLNEVKREIKEGKTNPILFLVGNKCDLDKNRDVSTDMGRAVAVEGEMTFFETSAKDGTNLDTCFFKLTETIRCKKLKEKIKKKEEKEDDKELLLTTEKIDIDEEQPESTCLC